MSLRFGAATLLLTATSAAVVLGLIKLYWGIEASFLAAAALAATLFWTVGFAAGGWAARQDAGIPRHWLAALVFGLIHSGCWLCNDFALDFAGDPSAEVQAEILENMISVHQAHGFDAIAGFLLAAIVSAAWRRSTRGIWMFGGAAIGFWLIVFAFGYSGCAVGLVPIFHVY